MTFLADANPYISAQSWLNSGDTAWQLTAATFVGMQSIPGLAILYAGFLFIPAAGVAWLLPEIPDEESAVPNQQPVE